MNVDNSTCNVLSLFSGGGGLDHGLRLAVPNARTVCYVEREAYAGAILAARMEKGGDLDCAPVWSDVSTFDGRPWHGVVDLIVGGFPCQDISNAGKRAGIKAGNRSGLWFEYARILGEVRPRFVFIENVGALVRRGLDIVLSDLASLGFDAEWGIYSAAEIGAPHRRQRLFILADSGRVGGFGVQPELYTGIDYSLLSRVHGPALANPHVQCCDVCSEPGWNDISDADRGGAEMGDADGPRSQRRRGGELGGADKRAPWPPDPSDRCRWSEYLRANPSLEPAIRRGSDGLANRIDRLRALGNGVVPDQAAYAFLDLAERFGL